MDDERGRRIGLNEAVFREVNERIQDVAESFEGNDPTCVQHITLTRADYEAVRADPTHFAVASGHEISDVEEVVDKRNGYDVIRKQVGAAAKVAEETDPRS